MQFCVRDDDTSFFTRPEDLEEAYGEVTRCGAVSLAVVPFHRAGTSRQVPEAERGRWTVHPLHENRELVAYLRERAAAGRYEIMLHGYHHDAPDGPEFVRGKGLALRVGLGREYLESLLGVRIRVFVPPKNAIGRAGLRAVARAGLHLGGVAGVRGGWPLFSPVTWRLWWKLRRWRRAGGVGVPWVLDLKDHREIRGNPVTPIASYELNHLVFDRTLEMGGVFCAATHYWEREAPSVFESDPPVGEHLRSLIERAASDARVSWRSVGEAVCRSAFVL